MNTTMELIGSLDRLDSSYIEGWLTAQNAPTLKIPLEVLLDGKVIGHCIADRFRQDLADAGIGGGTCAFSFEMPAFVPASSLRQIEIAVTGSPFRLDISAKIRSQAKEAGEVRPTVSRFGGLWVDRTDFMDRLGAKHRSGELSDELADQLTHFVRDGYVVLKKAVSGEILDKINADIERVWRAPPEGLLIETFEPDGVMRYITPDLAWRDGATKMLDLYNVSSAAREAVAAPAATAFLTALFEAPPKAFQGLTFWNGSQQDIHKDTAYVKIDSNPMNLAASWLALEDISPGTGELEYYVGSHRAPDFLFGGTSKWMELQTSEHAKFLASLHEDAARYGHKRASFLAKAGDILIWHADLAHGGSKITSPGVTRRSLVTHFCPVQDEPFYRRKAKYPGTATGGVEFISQYGAVG